MQWFAEVWDDFYELWPAILFIGNLLILVGSLTWVLMTKSDSTSAVAWCLVILLVPYLGALLFVLFGYQHVHRPLKRKRRHKKNYQRMVTGPEQQNVAAPFEPGESLAGGMQRLADRVGASPLTLGNEVVFFNDGVLAFEAMLEAIQSARHHIHLEFFIFHPDELGKEVLGILTAKAKSGIEVRLLYDAMGSHHLPQRLVKPLRAVGGKVSEFLPINPLRRRFQINMRNHRKILVVDGNVAFVGGLNIGDEYVGKNAYFGYWRDTHMLIRGPAVRYVQAVFCEDWDFAAEENLRDAEGSPSGCRYFEPTPVQGPCALQIIDSGPDRDMKSIREIYFAAILRARRRVWIASPYFVPDAGILDALRLAAYLGVDVRFLGQFRPDKWVPQLAAQYYWGPLLEVGVKIYQYTRGMMHAKVMIVDDDWASVGSANLDNRSLHLNFELNCLIYTPDAVRQLAETFEQDLENSIRLDTHSYLHRPFATRLLENACRLMSPVL